MNQHRVICLSYPSPACSAEDVLAVCHGFPERNAQAGIGGKVLCVGEQFVLLLEGKHHSVLQLVERIRRDVPEAGMTIQWRETVEDRAFSTWSIGDVYLDEVEQLDAAAAEGLKDLVIDLLAGSPVADGDEAAEPRDLFAETAALLEGFAWTAGRRPAAPEAAEAA